jgi:hypothetical protein
VPRSFHDPYKYMPVAIQTVVPQKFKNKLLNQNVVRSSAWKEKFRFIGQVATPHRIQTLSNNPPSGGTTEQNTTRFPPTQKTTQL